MSTTETSMSDNGNYPKLCSEIASNDELFDSFRSSDDSIYKGILEHVHPQLGYMYYQTIKEYYPEISEEVIGKASSNDIKGRPAIISYPFGDYCPSSLRYLKVALDLLKCFPEIGDMNVLEIGGGYGGQCVVSDAISGFSSWTIVDLPEVNELQKRYLKDADNVSMLSCHNEIFEEKYDLVISNYAFSECIREYQDKYIKSFMNNGEKIYMTCNFHGDIDNRYTKDEIINGIGCEVVDEFPLTYPNNIIAVKGHCVGSFKKPSSGPVGAF